MVKRSILQGSQSSSASIDFQKYTQDARAGYPEGQADSHIITGIMKREADGGTMTGGGGGGGGGGGPTSPHKRYRQGDDELRLLIPSKVAGSIIGKGGQNITKLRSQYKASIIVPDCPGPERILTISSDLDTVLQVVNEVVPNLEENGSRHGSDEIDVRMLVHQSQAGCIIGKGGFKIKELREKTGARIKIYSNCCPQSTDRLVSICGKPSTCVDSIREIISLIKISPVKGINNPYDPHNYDDFYAEEYGGYGGSDGPGGQNKGSGYGGPGGRGGGGGGGGMSRREGRGGGGGGGVGGGVGVPPEMNRGFPPPRPRGGPPGSNMSGPPDRGYGGGVTRGGGGGGYDGGRGNGGGYSGNRGGPPLYGGGGGNYNDNGWGIQGGALNGIGGGGNGGNSGMGGPPLGGNPGGNQGGNLGGGGGGGKGSTQVTIPKDLAGAIIGKGGARIRKIRSDSGAGITIDEPLPGSNDRIITITGLPNQIQMAQYLLQQSVHENSEHY
ncbi:heterogeneous nuclear ribonucleoprotein K isoform X2 [Athalia rosae]|uniref:heterogeneous nuclear ribonucleoprotein K isoform X2 n=1 Tax=Athalia rosae TaxID=37344 RepID=UPI0020336187|nr:heterogeneous nuclear ribonucleoprotein K isoform X2 [Athalia rosae]